MGFTQADFQEMQAKLNSGKVRFGPRIVSRERLNVLYQGVRPEQPQKPARRVKEPKPPPEPGFERYQQRLPGF